MKRRAIFLLLLVAGAVYAAGQTVFYQNQALTGPTPTLATDGLDIGSCKAVTLCAYAVTNDGGTQANISGGTFSAWHYSVNYAQDAGAARAWSKIPSLDKTVPSGYSSPSICFDDIETLNSGNIRAYYSASSVTETQTGVIVNVELVCKKSNTP